MALSWLSSAFNDSNIAIDTEVFVPLTGSRETNQTEAVYKRPIEGGYTFKLLWVDVSLNSHDTDGDAWFRVNGADTALTVTIPSNTTGEFTDLTSEVSVSAGDEVNHRIMSGGGTGTLRVDHIDVAVEPTGGVNNAVTFLQSGSTLASGSTFNANNDVEFVGLVGLQAVDNTDPPEGEQIYVRMDCGAEHLWATLNSNTRVDDENLHLYKNTAQVNGHILIPGSTAGIFTDVTNSDTIAYGDRLEVGLVTTGGGGSMVVRDIGLDLQSSKKLFLLGAGNQVTHNDSQTRVTGFGDQWQNTETSGAEHRAQNRFTLARLSMHIRANNLAGTEATQTLFIDGVASALGLTIPGFSTGLFEDLVTNVVLPNQSTLHIVVVSGSSGTNIQYGRMTVVATESKKIRPPAGGFNLAPDGTALGMGQPVCIQIGPSVTATPGVGGLTLAGLAIAAPQNAVIIPVPAGHMCLRGPLADVVDVPIAIPVGSLTFTGQSPTLGFEVHPGVGALVFTGQAPTAAVTVRRDMGVGALVFTGQGTTLDFGLHPGPGALVFAGQTPAAFVQRVAAPGAGALVFTGQTPRLGFELHPGVGPLVFAGQAPTVDITVLRAVPAGALVLQGQGTSLDFGLSPATGALVFTGQVPAAFVQRVVAPGAGTLAFAGQTPLCLVDDPTPIPAGNLVFSSLPVSLGFVCPAPAGALVFQGHAPGIFTGLLRSVPVGALVLQGQAPQAFVQHVVSVPVGALTLAGVTPSLDFGVPVPVGALVLAGRTPARLVDDPTPVPAGALVFAGVAPTLAHTLPVPAGALVFAGQTPARLVDQPIAVPVGTLVFAGQPPTLGFGITIPAGALVFTGQTPRLGFVCPAPAGALVFAGLVPTVDIGVGDKVFAVPVGALVLQGQTPDVVAGTLVPTGALVLTGQAPSLGFAIGVPAGTLVLAGQAPDGQVPLVVPTGSLTFAGQAPVSLATQSINVPVGELRLDGHRPSFAGVVSIGVLRGILLLDGQTPFPGHGIPVGVGSLTLTGQAPTATATQITGPGAMVLQGHAPVCFTDSPTLTVPTGSLVLQGHAVGGVGGAITIAVPAGAIVCASQAEPVSVNPVAATVTTFKVRRERAGTFIVDELGWIYMARLQLDLEGGVGLDGLATLDGHDPQVRLQWSDDGGQTWSAERSVSAGKIGEHRRRVIWRRLGRSRKRVFRIRMDAPVKWAIVDAYARVTKGTS